MNLADVEEWEKLHKCSHPSSMSSIGWIGVDRFEGVWHPNFINPLEYEKSFQNQLCLPQAQLFCAPPPVTTGYAQTNRPGQIGLNQYYDYCRCHHQHSFQRNGWTLKILLLCLITLNSGALTFFWGLFLVPFQNGPFLQWVRKTHNSNGFPVNFCALNIFWFYQSTNFY